MEGFFDGEAQYRAGRGPTFKRSCLHEIKHDGFRVIARKTDNRVKLYADRAKTSPTAFHSFAWLSSQSRLPGKQAEAEFIRFMSGQLPNGSM